MLAASAGVTLHVRDAAAQAASGRTKLSRMIPGIVSDGAARARRAGQGQRRHAARGSGRTRVGPVHHARRRPTSWPARTTPAYLSEVSLEVCRLRIRDLARRVATPLSIGLLRLFWTLADRADTFVRGRVDEDSPAQHAILSMSAYGDCASASFCTRPDLGRQRSLPSPSAYASAVYADPVRRSPRRAS